MSPTFFFAGVLFIGMAAQWIAWRFRLPVIVLLLGFGVAIRFLIGPPEQFIPAASLYPLVALAVGIILFEGGLSLQLREVRNTGGAVFRLVTVGLLITWVLTAFAAYWILGFSSSMAALTGALLTVSGPTVIVPLLRHVQPVRRVGSVIKWEGIVNDPIGAVLAALVFEAIVHGAGSDSAGQWLYGLGMTVLVGGLCGGLTAWILVSVLRRYWVPDFLQNPIILATVVMIFAVSNYFQHESGLVTVTILGVLLANQHAIPIKRVVEFKENLRTLLISTLFIVLASNVDMSWPQLQGLGWPVLWFLAALMLVVRPIAVFVSTIGSELKLSERVLLSWIHPRGIVAAAVASLLAAALMETAYAEEAESLVLVTFLVIVTTVTVYGLTLAPLARWLGLASPNPQGILFAGASQMVREIAGAVKDEGFQTMLVDTNRHNISETRLEGLPVCFASIGSDFVRNEVDLGDIGRLLAMTPNDEVNTLAVMEFNELFGRADTYQLATAHTASEKKQKSSRTPDYRRGRILFRDDATYSTLAARWRDGARIKKTLLTEDFSFEDFATRYGESAIVLFIVDGQGKLVVKTDEDPPPAQAGQKVIALVDPVEPDDQDKNEAAAPPTEAGETAPGESSQT